MSLRYYIDQNVHAGIVAGLRRRGIDCLTAYEDGAADWDDPLILQRATELGRVVVTQDIDFTAITHEWIDAGRPLAGVAFASQITVTIGQAIASLELMAVAMGADEMHDKIEYLPI